MPHNETPLWIEYNECYARDFWEEYEWPKYELLMFRQDYYIIFYGRHYKLIRQQYNFLKNILCQNGKKISANKLMEQIDSKCKIELRSKLAYRIKAKIKAKIKENWDDTLPSYTSVEWMILDRTYEHNELPTVDSQRNFHYKCQYCSLDTVFGLLIRVKYGNYYTSFRKYKHVNKMLQKPVKN